MVSIEGLNRGENDKVRGWEPRGTKGAVSLLLVLMMKAYRSFLWIPAEINRLSCHDPCGKGKCCSMRSLSCNDSSSCATANTPARDVSQSFVVSSW